MSGYDRLTARQHMYQGCFAEAIQAAEMDAMHYFFLPSPPPASCSAFFFNFSWSALASLQTCIIRVSGIHGSCRVLRAARRNIWHRKTLLLSAADVKSAEWK